MSSILKYIVILAIGLGGLFYCVSAFTLTGSMALEPEADVDHLMVRAWLWGGGSLLFLGVSVFGGGRVISTIKNGPKTPSDD